ncbi:MAG: hypothetical protein AAGG75_04135 [Bacteroidota bacterium]
MQIKTSNAIKFYAGTPQYKDYFNTSSNKAVGASLLFLVNGDDVYLIAYDLPLHQSAQATVSARRLSLERNLPENQINSYAFLAGGQHYVADISDSEAPTLDLLDNPPPGEEVLSNNTGDINIHYSGDFLFEVDGVLQQPIPDVAVKHNVLLLQSPQRLFLLTTVVNRGEIVIDRLDIARSVPQTLNFVQSFSPNVDHSYQLIHGGYSYSIDLSDPDEPVVNRSKIIIQI